MKFLIFLCLFLFANCAYGQYYRPYYNQNILRYQNFNRFPVYIPVPIYQNQVRRLTPDQIRERWAIQDEYKERNKTENYLDRKERMLDQAERAYELNSREEYLRSRGILPPKKQSGIVFNDKHYSSYEELSESEEYQSYIESKRIERKEKEWQKQFEKERYSAFIQMWHRLSDSGKEQFGRLSYEEKESRIDEYHFKILLKE